jgi:hypothetical protein
VPFFGVTGGEGPCEDAKARRHGRPFAVMPLHVVAGFRESARARNDSGVLAI